MRSTSSFLFACPKPYPRPMWSPKLNAVLNCLPVSIHAGSDGRTDAALDEPWRATVREPIADDRYRSDLGEHAALRGTIAPTVPATQRRLRVHPPSGPDRVAAQTPYDADPCPPQRRRRRRRRTVRRRRAARTQQSHPARRRSVVRGSSTRQRGTRRRPSPASAPRHAEDTRASRCKKRPWLRTLVAAPQARSQVAGTTTLGVQVTKLQLVASGWSAKTLTSCSRSRMVMTRTRQCRAERCVSRASDNPP